jgi:hypothetical protein
MKNQRGIQKHPAPIINDDLAQYPVYPVVPQKL